MTPLGWPTSWPVCLFWGVVKKILVELAKQAEHLETAALMLEYMAKCPHIFTPMQGTPTVHQHKQMKLEGGGLHHFNDDM